MIEELKKLMIEWKQKADDACWDEGIGCSSEEAAEGEAECNAIYSCIGDIDRIIKNCA